MILGPCKHNIICCDALQSAAVLTLHQGEQAGCIKAERERCGLMRAYTLGHLMRHHVVVAFSEASFKGLLAFTSTHRPL